MHSHGMFAHHAELAHADESRVGAASMLVWRHAKGICNLDCENLSRVPCEHLAPLHCPLSEPRPAPPLRRMAPTPFELVVAEPYRRLQSSQDQGDLGNTVRRCTATAHAAAPRGCRTFPCLPNAALSLPTKWTRLVLTTALRGAAHVSQLAILLGLIIMLTGVCAFLGWYSRRRG